MTNKKSTSKKTVKTHKPNSEKVLTPQEEQQGVESANPDAEKEETTVSEEGDAKSISEVLKKNRQG